jgi:TRAP-type C4-dicarboxylate transport system substrate-binding protein
MNSIRATEKQMRNLQKQRHAYDIQVMVLSNPLFKNLGKRDQKNLVKLIYKAEMMEMFMRDSQIVRINDSFDQIVEDVANMLNERYEGDEDGEEEQR